MLQLRPDVIDRAARRGAGLGLLLVLGGLMLSPAAAAQDSSAPAPAVPVRVTLASPTGAPLVGEGHVVFLGVGSEPPRVYAVKLPAAAAAQLPAGSQWTVRADFPGYFAPTSLLRVPESPISPIGLTVALRPASLLTGTFSLKEADDKPPERLEVRFEPARDGSSRAKEAPAGGGVCATSPERKWRCTVPAGRLDIALHPGGFVPHYLWRVPVTAGETKSLGNLVLRRGASVAGWVALEDGTPPKVCTVRLQPAEAPSQSNDPVLRLLRQAAIEVPCQPGGFFQFVGVAAGSYALVAESGRARAALSPLEVWNGAESRLASPLVLKLPVDFALELAPATDWMGRPWRVEVRRASDYRSGWEEPPIRAAPRADGRVPLPAQLPGRFSVTVYDWAGNAVFSDSFVELSEPTQAYFIPLALLWLEGSVRLGDEPLQGRLFFGGRSGATKITMESDADGRFEGPLPKDGRWPVDIESDKPFLKTSALAQVKRDGNEASVTIELPGTRVQGRVVDPAGNPAARAYVTLTSLAGPVSTESDAKGEFEFRAFPEGTIALSAERSAGGGGREQSETQTFEAAADAVHGLVVLALQRNVAVRGRVLAATGPVIGAMVYAWPTSGGSGSVSTVRTRPDGSFELKLPERTSAMHVVVSPPGGKLKAYEVRLAGAEEVVLPIGTEGGELLVDLGKRDPEVFAMWQDEIGIPFGVLATWTLGNGVPFMDGSRVRLPQLAAGFYTVCSGPPEVAGDDTTWKARARCASGYLAAGSALELRLP
ncbi:MAG TPA: carboxypeptidase-like regulatory domain-containing protein [Thermoanaerobaculia bacterium]|nr:carboxypeptidase-like regulatory domain-containing protein [Thermoanaerobaculia bacterium]